MSIPELTLKCEEIRKRLLEVVYKAKAGHIGGDLSSLNVLTALYMRVMNVNPENPKMEGRDRFIMSKGHCVEALYCVLEAKGFITKELVDTYGDYLSVLAGHPTVEVPGIEFNSGALGHGLSIGVGCAIAAKWIRSLIVHLYLWAMASRAKAQYMRQPWPEAIISWIILLQ